MGKQENKGLLEALDHLTGHSLLQALQDLTDLFRTATPLDIIPPAEKTPDNPDTPPQTQE